MITNRRKHHFYLLTVLASLVLVAGLSEIILSFSSFSRGDNRGAMARRWLVENWHPVNEMRYRDTSLYSKNTGAPQVFFLGDSFTAGHGVAFEDAYYWKTLTRMPTVIEGYNISMNGFSTRDQRAALISFTSITNINPNIVVHQYFGNDIENYIDFPEMRDVGSLEEWLRKSELVDFVLGGLEYREWGLEYLGRLIDAYKNEDSFLRHSNDITLLHNYIRSYGARVVFILFPSLDGGDSSQLLNHAYVDRVKNHFLATCSLGDVLLDVSVVSSNLSPRRQVVNFMDPHPSPELHALVATELAGVLMPMIYGDEKPQIYRQGIHWCE